MRSPFGILSLRFDQTLSGIGSMGDGGQEALIEAAWSARPTDEPGRGFDLFGTITIPGIATSRPLSGTMAGSELTLRFSDDDWNPLELSARTAGSFLGGKVVTGEAMVRDADGAQRLAVRSARLGPPTSLRPARRRRRPKFRDRVAAFMRRKDLPLPRRGIAVALAEAALPAGRVLDPGGEETIVRIEKSPLVKSRLVLRILGTGLFGVEWLSRLGTGTRFSKASPEERARFLEEPPKSLAYRVGRTLLSPINLGLMIALKYFHVSTEDAHQRLGTTRLFGVAPDLVAGEDGPDWPYAPEPPEPWMTQVMGAEKFDTDEEVEADVLVVGTGAGGGPVAKELAERGFAVAIVEGGKLFRREDRVVGAQDFTIAVGNGAIVLPMGRAVGGTTFINAGTCFRTPDDVLLDWAGKGMPELHPDRMAGYFDRVEQIIQVAEADPKYVGPVGEVIRRGCERLEYSSKNLRRNAPNCEGKAICSLGCPHGAKQSTDKSYVPLALKSKATLFTGFKVRDILTDGRRAMGISAYGKGEGGRPVRLTVFARAVVLAAGALTTPVLIQQNGLAKGNPWVGRNLSCHPASGAAAIVPGVEMRTHECIPQGYCVHEFQDQGLMFEGANIPLSVWAALLPGAGRSYIELVEKFPNMANFGYMVEDTSRGRVWPGPNGRPLVTYWMNRYDTDRMVKGMAILSRIFFAAGAERVYGIMRGFREFRDEEDVQAFETKRWTPRDFLLTAYHCLGTARVGPDPSSSAIDMDHQCHHLPGLFVVDGSAVPASIGVNPQETIMAMATRAAERIAEIMERP